MDFQRWGLGVFTDLLLAFLADGCLSDPGTVCIWLRASSRGAVLYAWLSPDLPR